MKKYTSKEAYFGRIKSLADVDKTSVNETTNRNLGNLIDFKRAANRVAYGIVQEKHKYYIKKGGLNENQTVADFAYIGGLSNITNYEYKSLKEADKNRNMLLKTINESLDVRPLKSVGKKKMLTEDKAAKEIAGAESKLGDLDAATAAAEVPAAPIDDLAGAGDAEMDAGLDAAGGDPALGDAEMAAPDAEMAADSGEEGGADEATREIEKALGKLTNTLRKTELTEPQVKSYVNTFLSAFKDDFPEIDIEDRKEMAEKITKVVPDSEIADLGQNVEDSEADTEITATEPEEVAEEQQCAECGGFAKYAESRGYNTDSIKECGEEEMTNLVSGYANAHSEGQNDGDFKAIALFITPEILAKLKGDYGHDEFAGQVEPFSTEMNEASAEDKDAQINELFGGLKNLASKGAQAVGKAGQAIGQGIANKAQQVGQAVGQVATNVKQTYHAGEVPAEVKKLEGIATNLGQQIDALNKRMVKAGKEPVNIGSILTTIKNQVAGGGTANLSKYTNEEGIPVDNVEVQPTLEEAAIEEDVDIKVSEKAGKKLSPDNVPQVEMKEAEEKEGDDIDIDSLDVSGEESPEVPISVDGEESPLDLTKHKEPEMPMISGVDSMGGGVVKPDGAETTTVEVTKDSVNVTLNETIKSMSSTLNGISKSLNPTTAPKVISESEKKLRKYIRNRLEEKAGLKQPVLSENKKSETLLKLDKTIDKQFKLYETVALKNGEELNELWGFGVADRFAKLDPNDAASIENLFVQAFKNILNNPQMSAIGRAAKTTPPEVKYQILQQFVNGKGGSLRLADRNTVRYVPQSVKDAATANPFKSGGTGGKMGMGGV